MKNRIIAVIVGVLAGWFVVYGGEVINSKVFPAPEGLDYTDKIALIDFIESLPTTAFLSMFLVWMISSFVGGFSAGKIVKSGWKKATIITGAILLFSNVANMFFIPHPLWLNVMTIIMYLPMAYLGGKLAN